MFDQLLMLQDMEDTSAADLMYAFVSPSCLFFRAHFAALSFCSEETKADGDGQVCIYITKVSPIPINATDVQGGAVGAVSTVFALF